jgi:hypothetical protein
MAPLLPRLKLHACMCLLLLLAVASPASIVVAEGECYNTAMKVPRWCRVEFIKALWNNDPSAIRFKCCIKLVCVNDNDCFRVLNDLCDYRRCIPYCSMLPPLRSSNNSSKPVPPPGHHH